MNARGKLGRRIGLARLFWVTVGLAVGVMGNAAERSERSTMQLSSPAFAEGQSIAAKYTCDEKDLSPPLKWSGVPAEAKSLALIADDPDAPVGIWVHRVIYDLKPQVTELPEDLPKTQYLPQGGKQGLNDFKRLGYGGPCPPGGKPHRYFFKLYALNTELGLKPGVSKKEIVRAMDGHILAQGQLMGTYKRKS